MNPAGFNELRLALILKGPAVKSAFVTLNKSTVQACANDEGSPGHREATVRFAFILVSRGKGNDLFMH